MRDLLSWNVSLGRWADVNVRLHVSFLVLIVVVLHLCSGGPDDRSVWPALAGLAILFAGVVAHELGHCLTVWKWGGRVERVVLGPWGGLTTLGPNREQPIEITTAVAGPAVNLVVSLMATATLAAMRQPVLPLFQPLHLPVQAPGLSFAGTLAMIAWINWLIVLINLLPAFPLDGARALRAMLRPQFGFRTAVVATWRTGFVTAAVLSVAGLMLHDRHEKAALACSLLGIFLYFSSWQEAERLNAPEGAEENDLYEYSYQSPDDDGPHLRHVGPLRRWLDRRRRARMARRLQQEREEESRVDEVLARLHSEGRDALSVEDQALLRRVSARYRERQS